MTKIRDRFWIPKLRQHTKRKIKQGHVCMRFRAIACPAPPVGNLPKDRTEGQRAFEVAGLDYAGPFYYWAAPKQEDKAFILLYSCSLHRAVYLDLLKSQDLQDLPTSLKKFITRRGRRRKLYSNNGSLFVAGSSWLRKVMKEEKLHDFLAKHEMKWQFNFSRTPLWGSQF